MGDAFDLAYSAGVTAAGAKPGSHTDKRVRAALEAALPIVHRAAADGARREAVAAIGEAWDKLLAHPGFHTQIVGTEADVLYGAFCRLLGIAPSSPDPVATRDADDWMLDGCIAFLVERGHRDLAAEMRARIMEHPEMRPDPVAAARKACSQEAKNG